MNEERSSDYYYDKGVEYFEAENYIAALAFFDRVRELGESDIGLDGHTAEAYKKIEEYEKSLVYYNRVISELEKNPQFTDDGKPIHFYSDRAFVHIALEKYDEAIADYDIAIEIEDDEAFYYDGRAQAKYNKENLADALADMCKALYLEDSLPWFWERRAALFAEIGKHEQASYDTFRAYLCQCTSKYDGEEARPPMEDNIIFAEGKFTVEKNPQDGIVFHLNNREGMPLLPELFYDGGRNALLRRRFDQFVFLENIPAGMKDALFNADTFFVTEIITVDDEGNPVSEDEYNTLYYKGKIRKHPADASLESIDSIKKSGYFFFSYLASRIRDQPNTPVNQIIGIEDYANLAAVLAFEEDYENLQRFHDEVLEGDEEDKGKDSFASLVLNRQISAAFQHWQPSPLFYIARQRIWQRMKDGAKMLRFFASFEGFNPDMPSAEGDTALYNQCLIDWEPDILRTLLEIGADPNHDCEMEEGTFRAFTMALLPDDFNEETNSFTPLNERHLERIKLLVDYGADVTYADSSGKTALSLVLNHTEGEIREELVKLFIEKGASIKEAIKGLKKSTAKGNHMFQKGLDDLHTLSIFAANSSDCLGGTGSVQDTLSIMLRQADEEILEEMKINLREGSVH